MYNFLMRKKKLWALSDMDTSNEVFNRKVKPGDANNEKQLKKRYYIIFFLNIFLQVVVGNCKQTLYVAC